MLKKVYLNFKTLNSTTIQNSEIILINMLFIVLLTLLVCVYKQPSGRIKIRMNCKIRYTLSYSDKFQIDLNIFLSLKLCIALKRCYVITSLRTQNYFILLKFCTHFRFQLLSFISILKNIQKRIYFGNIFYVKTLLFFCFSNFLNLSC